MKESARAGSPRRPLWPFAVLTAAVFAVFGRALACGFVAWDDDINVYQDPHLRPASAEQVLWFWRHPYEKLYVPLTYSAWSAVAAAGQWSSGNPSALPPLPFHLLNLLLHALNACLVFSILRLWLPGLLRETGPPARDWTALAGAALFALHPVQVEPVVWVSGLKDVLSGTFSLAAVLAYSRYAQDGSWRSYLWAAACFLAALSAKPAAACLPALLWIMDAGFWNGWKRASASLAPWFVLSAAAGLLTRSAQPVTGIYPDASLFPRFVVAGDALWFYLYKLAWPLALTVDYGRRPLWLLAQPWRYYTATLPALVLSVLAFLPRRRLWLACAALFVIGVAPVLGLIPFNHQTYSTVADRYMYLAMLGPALAFAAALALGSRRFPRGAWLCAGFVLIPAACLAVAASAPWKDTIALFEHCLEVNPRSSTAHNNLGYTLEEQGRLDEALRQYLEAVQADPEDGRALNNLGNFYLLRRGDVATAQRDYEQAVASGSDLVNAHNNLGVAYEREGRPREALEQYRRALALDPSYPSAYNDLGNVLSRMKDPAAAAAAYEEALQLDPASPQARLNLARLDNDLGYAQACRKRWNDAIALYGKSLALAPDAEDAIINLGDAYLATGRADDAEHLWIEAARRLPASFELRHDLGILYLRAGRREEAARRFREALRLNPGFEPSLRALKSLGALSGRRQSS